MGRLLWLGLRRVAAPEAKWSYTCTIEPNCFVAALDCNTGFSCSSASLFDEKLPLLRIPYLLSTLCLDAGSGDLFLLGERLLDAREHRCEPGPEAARSELSLAERKA